MAVLECLAAAGGVVVTRDELFNAVWPGVSVTDDALTQCVVELRKAFGDPAGDAQVIKTIPKVGYCLIPPVTPLTEEPAYSSDKPDRIAASVAHPVKPAIRVVFITAVAILLGLAVFWYLGASRNIGLDAPLNPVPSIAVLPFVDMSEGRDQEYFADGLSEELINRLAHLEGLRVTGRTSSFNFKESGEDLRVIGEILGVSHLLEGSVRKDREQLRITAQLLDASNGFHLWSESYDRKLEDIFAIQDEISAAIVAALNERLGLQLEAAPRVIATANTEAHDALLRGRHLLAQRTASAIEGAVREFAKAIVLDPEYALAHAELAIATLFLTQYASLTVTEAVTRAIPNVERAMNLDPMLAEAHAALGYVFRFQGNPEEALTHFREATRTNPNYSLVYNGMGIILGEHLGNYDEAFAVFQRALSLDPLMVVAKANYIRSLIERNRLAEADLELEKFASLSQRLFATFRGIRLALNGRWSYALLGNLEALRISPKTVNSRNHLSRQFVLLGLQQEALGVSENPLPVVFSMLGHHEDAVLTAQARLAKDPTYLTARHHLGLALAAAGDYARARPILEEMWQLSGGRVTCRGPFRVPTAAALIAIRRDAGKEDSVGELVAAIGENVHRSREAGITHTLWGGYETYLLSSIDYQEGLAAYLAGDRETGLALIAQAVEDGTFIPERQAYLQALYDDPGFAPIRASQEARRASERERFLAIVCNENPYATVWQPAEGTCERFAAEGEN
jgi:TolB-like protein/DNA-binding winged helix-turn-helix (wHTH) protein/Flp pilus assembly protein TadD